MCLLLGRHNVQQVVYRQLWDHAVTSPWTKICRTHLSTVVWQSRLLSLHLPWHNQQKLWLVGPPVTYTDKLQRPIRAQNGCPDHVCAHSERCDAGFLAFLAVLRDWRLHFLGQCELSQVGEAQGRWIAAQMQQKEIYLLKLPAIGHGRHHLCQLLLLALQHPVHMFNWNLRGRKTQAQHRDDASTTSRRTRITKEMLPDIKYLRCFTVAFPDLVLDELY